MVGVRIKGSGRLPNLKMVQVCQFGYPPKRFCFCSSEGSPRQGDLIYLDLQKVDCLLLSFLSISSEMQLSTLVAPADYTKAGTFDAARDLDDVI